MAHDTVGYSMIGWQQMEGWWAAQVREARAAAQAQAQDMKREDLESLQLRPPPKRALVAYDDL